MGNTEDDILEILNLFAIQNIFPDERGLTIATGQGYMKILNWGTKQFPPILPIDMNNAVMRGYYSCIRLG
ncbi:MAG: hypothetical protein JKX76_02530 [Colwellia sp.]|nr:hypothetical protein [Colwellia sp.]